MRWPALTVIGVLLAVIIGLLEGFTAILLDTRPFDGWRNRLSRRRDHGALRLAPLAPRGPDRYGP